MLILAMIGCTDGAGGTQQFAGIKMSDYFSFDGSRKSVFNNEDTTAIPWKLLVEKKSVTEVVESREIATVEYIRLDTGEFLGSVSWSSLSSEAVQVHSYSIGATGEKLTFDPPVAITDGDDAMRSGDAVETDTTDSGGTSWHFTSTFIESVSECPATAQDDFVKCVRFTIDDGDGEALVGPLFTGEFIFVAAWGTVYQTIPTWDTEWELTDIEYVAEGDE
ncbi:MAG: hypothetical protein EXR71_03610 [Myxococcales bacterium]|nr:hypothetical protein [Myxococcales bacterium]